MGSQKVQQFARGQRSAREHDDQGLQSLSTVHSVALEGSGTFHGAKFWSPHMKRDANQQPASGGPGSGGEGSTGGQEGPGKAVMLDLGSAWLSLSSYDGIRVSVQK